MLTIHRGKDALELLGSLAVAELTPEYGIGDCYPAACLGHARWLRSLEDDASDPEAYSRVLWAVTYCQGWHLRVWRDGTIDGFPHGFLLDQEAAEEGLPCIIDPLYPRYTQGYEPIWVPIQRWSYEQQCRWMDKADAGKLYACWPLTTRTGGTELDDRLGYRTAYQRAVAALTA